MVERILTETPLSYPPKSPLDLLFYILYSS